MASLVENLISILDEEEKFYCDLVPIAERKAEAIIKNNLDDLQKINMEEQGIVDRIGVLEQKRQEVVANIAIVMGQNAKDLNLHAIIEMLQKQPKEQMQLKRIHDKLKKSVERLQDVNAQNKLLIQDALEMVEFNMNYIRSTRMSSGSSNYSKRASVMDAPDLGAGTFDAKQ